MLILDPLSLGCKMQLVSAYQSRLRTADTLLVYHTFQRISASTSKPVSPLSSPSAERGSVLTVLRIVVVVALYRLLCTLSSLHWNPASHETLQLRDGPGTSTNLGDS